MSDYTVKIVNAVDEHTFDENGKTLEKVRVTFRVGADGPFVRRFTKDEFSGYQAKAALEAFATELRTLRGE